MTAETTPTRISVVYQGRRLDAQGRLFHHYQVRDDQGEPTGRTMGFSKPLHRAQRPGTILDVSLADEGRIYTAGQYAPDLWGVVEGPLAAEYDALDRAAWATWNRKRADVRKAAEATSLRDYLAPIHRAYVELSPQARTAFLAEVMDAVMQPRWGK